MRLGELEGRITANAQRLLAASNTVITIGTRYHAGNPVLRRRFVLTNWVLLGSLAMLSLIAPFDALVTGYKHLAAMECATFAGLAWCWAALRRGASIDRVTLLTTLIVGAAILFAVFFGYARDSVLVWAPIFPALPIFLLGPRRGIYLVAVFDAILFTGLGVSVATSSHGYSGVSLFNAIGASLAMALLVFYYESSRADAYRHLEDAANTDPLTGALNRRGFRDRFETELGRARRTGAPLSLLVLDIDHFKRINDRFGHDVGDAAIQHVIRLLAANTRRYDVVARLGGEEFAVLLPETVSAQAAIVAEKLRQIVADTPMPLPDGLVPLTVSIGLAQVSREADQFAPLFSLADRRLYAAKESGRNRVVAD